MKGPDVDTIFHYQGFHGCASRCHLRIWRRDGDAVVVVTELGDNPGTSVTNAVEIIAADVVVAYNLDPRRMVWIEHYSAESFHGDIFAAEGDRFDLVRFDFVRTDASERFSTPQWQHLPRAQALALLSGTLDR